MTSSIHNLTDQTLYINQLLIELQQKEDEIQYLKNKYEDNLSSFEKNLHYSEQQLRPIHHTLQEKITQIAIHHLSHEKKLDSISQMLKSKIDDSLNRLELIENKLTMLDAKYRSTLKAKVKEFFQPRLGRLYQYSPRPFSISNEYYKTIPSSTTLPTISIVTPSFNQNDFLERTILSVTRQKYPALEYIIQDGASEDDTIEVIKRYESSLKHWESAEDTGQSQAINLGFRHATGEIMAYLNSDDILLPGTLHYVANYFQKHPNVDVVYGHRVLINENDYEIGRWVLPPHDSDTLTWADYVPQETLFWRRKIWDKVGGKIDETFSFAMDWDLILRFRDANAKFARLPRFLGAFRVHSNQKTSSEMSKTGLKEMDRLRLRCHGRLVSHHEISKNIRFYLIKHVLFNKLHRLGILRY